MPENNPAFSAPLLVYIGLGLVTARILLANTKLRGQSWLEWLQFLVKGGSIVLLWPLVLFLEKFETWLKSSDEEKK